MKVLIKHLKEDEYYCEPLEGMTPRREEAHVYESNNLTYFVKERLRERELRLVYVWDQS